MPGHDAFDAAAESGEKMRLDEAGDDAHIGFDDVAIDQRRRAVARRAELHVRAGILRFMVEHAIVRARLPA